MKKWITHWEIWLEAMIGAVILMAVYRLFGNIGPIWQAITRFIGILRPFFIGFVIAYILNAPCKKIDRFLNRLGLGRRLFLSVLLTYIAGFSLLGVIIGIILPMLALNIWEFVSSAPLYLDWLSGVLGDEFVLATAMSEFFSGAIGDLSTIQGLFSQLGDGLTSIGSYAWSMTSGIFDLFLGLVISFYLLLYKESALDFFERLLRLFIKKTALVRLKNYARHSNEIFYRFIACQLLDATILGTVSAIVLSLIGVEFALTLGFIIGLFNMIPYIGSIFSFSLAVVVALLAGSPMTALLTAIFLLLLQQLDNTVIGPRLIGNALDLNPIMIIFAITLGRAYFGVGGMFLGIPLAAILKICLGRFLDRKSRVETGR